MHTAERVSARDASDNYVFQRSILAYHEAASIVSGNVLEIGTGMGYGIEVVAPAAARFITVDKSVPVLPTPLPDNAEFRRMSVPPIDFPDGSFDCVISFQVIEHIRREPRTAQGGSVRSLDTERTYVAHTQSVACTRIYRHAAHTAAAWKFLRGGVPRRLRQ